MICGKDLVVSEIACNHADLRYMLATDHLCKSTFECITAGGPSPAYVPTFHSVLSSTLSPYCSTAYQPHAEKRLLQLIHCCTYYPRSTILM